MRVFWSAIPWSCLVCKGLLKKIKKFKSGLARVKNSCIFASAFEQ